MEFAGIARRPSLLLADRRHEVLRQFSRKVVGFALGRELSLGFGVVFSGNGFHAKEWWARGAGAAMELGQACEPLNEI